MAGSGWVGRHPWIRGIALLFLVVMFAPAAVWYWGILTGSNQRLGPEPGLPDGIVLAAGGGAPGSDAIEPSVSTIGSTKSLACPDSANTVRQTSFTAPPPVCINPEHEYAATLVTSNGEIVIDLMLDDAPIAVNNFVFLARHNYYDGSFFHRVVEDFMIQGGDPNGDPVGTGGPGYTIPDELPARTYTYRRGDVAMARTSAPDTGGSQFFIVTADDGVNWLEGGYTLFGRVSDGLEVVDGIESSGLSSGIDEIGADRVIEDVKISER